MTMDERDLHPAVRDIARDIETMERRGAAEIADAAATALATQARKSDAGTADALQAELWAVARLLEDTRPTAVTLPNALRFVLNGLDADDLSSLRTTTLGRAEDFHERLDRMQADLGQIGAGRLRDGDTIMTHCHSTAVISVVEAAVAQDKALSAVVTETRPRNQGHITAAALRDLGVDVTLIVDGATRRYLADVDHVLVGADSIAADGSVINKIGTSGLAVLARDRGTPITVAAGTIKLDPATLYGGAVEIEMREESEIIGEAERADIGDIAVENPAFDVTPPRYLDAIVTERGQFPPESIVTLMRELYGERAHAPWRRDG
jgi:ribose 1,5-bisphosphate isomerase